MKDVLRNYLKEHDEVVAVYCKVVSSYGTPVKDMYVVVFHQDGGGAFSISDDFTEEELTKAKRYWKFVENWYEVKSMKDSLQAKVSGGNYINGLDDCIDKVWEEWKQQGYINCKGERD